MTMAFHVFFKVPNTEDQPVELAVLISWLVFSLSIVSFLFALQSEIRLIWWVLIFSG